MAVPKEITVVTMSRTGASTERSSAMRMTKMTTRTIGMMRLRS